MSIQVYLVDVDVNEGKNVQKEFEDEFGEGMATFLECNVADKDIFEGKIVRRNILKLQTSRIHIIN